MRRISLLLALAVSGVLLLAGFRPDALPFFNDEARYSDAVISHWPNALYLRESVLQRGEFPVWRETIMGGQPFAANPLNKTAYPLQWLVLLLPPTLHLNMMIVLHLLLAGVGMGAWARAIGLPTDAAVVSALGYALSPALLSHIGAGHLDILYALAWWPFLMLAVRRLGDKRQAALLLALTAALVFLADVRVSLFALLTAGVYAIFRLYLTKQPGRVLSLVLAGGLFLLLTAAVTVPLLAWSPYLSRTALTPADAGMLALQPGHFLGLLLFAVPPGVETLTYLGLPVLALAVVGLWTGRFRWLGLAVFMVIVLYALGANAPLWPLLTRLVPGLLWFRVPGRVWLIAVLFAPLLAGFGWQRVMTLVERLRAGEAVNGLRAVRLITAAFTTVVIACGLFALTLLKLPGAIGSVALVVGGGLGIVLLLGLAGRLPPRWMGQVLLALVVVDLVWVGVHWMAWRDEDQWLDAHRPLAEALAADGAARVYSPTYSLEQQVAEAYGLRLFGGVDPFQLQGIVSAVEQGSGVKAAGYSVVLPAVAGANGDDLNTANREAVLNTQVLAAWDVSHVAVAYALDDPHLEYVTTSGSVFVYRNRDYTAAMSAASIPGWPSGWPGLPDAATVTWLNQITLAAALASLVAWLLSIALYLFPMPSFRAAVYKTEN